MRRGGERSGPGRPQRAEGGRAEGRAAGRSAPPERAPSTGGASPAPSRDVTPSRLPPPVTWQGQARGESRREPLPSRGRGAGRGSSGRRGGDGGGGGMGESIPLGAPVPVEQAVLETFFSHLGIFSYDKAKDNVEKEREANKSAGASWLALLAGLAHLAAAEKAYHSMTFLGQKLGTAGPLPATPRVLRAPRPSPGRPSLSLSARPGLSSAGVGSAAGNGGGSRGPVRLSVSRCPRSLASAGCVPARPERERWVSRRPWARWGIGYGVWGGPERISESAGGSAAVGVGASPCRLAGCPPAVPGI